jgi:hypothetical protein
MNRSGSGFCFAVAMLSIGCSTVSTAPQATTFQVPLTPAAGTPPCASAGAAAKGTATITVAADNASIVATVAYSDLFGPVTGAHIHSGTSAAPGPVVLPFTGSLDSPFTKTLTASDYVAAAGAPADFSAFVIALKGGGAAYVNVHTAACKGGEIRGEIQ